MNQQVKIIDNSHLHKCYKCSGKGEVPYKNVYGEQLHFIEEKEKCSTCNGTGKWKEEHFFLITKTPSGQEIAFDVDNLGK